MNKVVAAIGIIVGGLTSIFNLLVAFGVSITADQETAIASICGLVLLVLGVWFHPSIPVGVAKDPTKQ